MRSGIAHGRDAGQGDMIGMSRPDADEREMLHGKRVPPECTIQPYAAA